jgi:hypothetical protein
MHRCSVVARLAKRLSLARTLQSRLFQAHVAPHSALLAPAQLQTVQPLTVCRPARAFHKVVLLSLRSCCSKVGTGLCVFLDVSLTLPLHEQTKHTDSSCARLARNWAAAAADNTTAATQQQQAQTVCVSWSSLSLILQVSKLPPILVAEMDDCVYTNVILASSNNELHEVNIIYVFLQLINFVSTYCFIIRDCIIIHLRWVSTAVGVTQRDKQCTMPWCTSVKQQSPAQLKQALLFEFQGQ